MVEERKEEWGVQEYLVGETTLEQIFQRFAGKGGEEGVRFRMVNGRLRQMTQQEQHNEDLLEKQFSFGPKQAESLLPPVV